MARHALTVRQYVSGAMRGFSGSQTILLIYYRQCCHRQTCHHFVERHFHLLPPLIFLAPLGSTDWLPGLQGVEFCLPRLPLFLAPLDSMGWSQGLRDAQFCLLLLLFRLERQN